MPEVIELHATEEEASAVTLQPLYRRLREMGRTVDRSSYSFDKVAIADLLHEAADALVVREAAQ